MLLDGRQYQVMPHLLLQWRESTRAIEAEPIADFALASSVSSRQVKRSLLSSRDHSYLDSVSIKQKLASAYKGRKSSLREDPFADE